MEDPPEEVLPTSRRKIQEVDCGVDHGWAAVYRTVAKRMLVYLSKSGVMSVDAQELEFHVLAPNDRNMRLWSPVWRDGISIKGCS